MLKNTYSRSKGKHVTMIDPSQLEKVKMEVICARDLIAADAGGTSDPYVSIKLRDGFAVKSNKTKVIPKNLNPSWKETFDFAVAKNLKDSADFLLRVWDKDLVGKDFLGEVCIPVSTITKNFGDEEPKWYRLSDKNGSYDKNLGEICIQIGFDSFEEEWAVLNRRESLLTGTQVHDTDVVSNLSPADLKQVLGVLSLEIKRGVDLPKDKKLGIMDCDPFVVVSFGASTFRTRIIRHNHNPVWNESLVVVVKKVEQNYTVNFSVYDFDQFSSNDFIASASVPVATFMDATQSEEREIKLQLKKQDGFDRSKLIVQAHFQTFDDLKKQFWQKLAETFDTNDSRTLDKMEFMSMLDTLNTTTTQEQVEEIFRTHGNKEEFTFEEIAPLIDDVISSHKATEKIFSLDRCPFTGQPLPQNDEDALLHLAIQASADLSKVDQFVMGGFITEAYARKGWFDKIVTYVSRGDYNIGADNANILVQDRRTGQLIEEKMPSYIRIGIRALYQTKLNKFGLGRSSVKNLLQSMSVKQGIKFDHPDSVKSIAPFIEFHRLPVDEILEPMENFKCFNEFFYRKLKPSARPVGSPDPKVLLSPADSRMMAFQHIDDATKLWIKGANFTVSNLIQDEKLAIKYAGGSLAIFRLAPQDYHRYHSPCDGTLGKHRDIPGTLYTVNPMAVREKQVDVYTENKRAIWTINSDHFGDVTLVIIGAMMVGSIVLTAVSDSKIKRNEELGYFAFGGSTVVALFEPGKVQFDADLNSNAGKQLETLVMVGEAIGKAK